MTAERQETRRRWVFGPVLEEWLIIEHADGRIEDLGVVEAQFLQPGEEGDPEWFQFQWRTLDRSRQAAVPLGDGDRDAEGVFRHPYIWRGAGGPQRWYVGPNAYRKAVDAGLIVGQPSD